MCDRFRGPYVHHAGCVRDVMLIYIIAYDRETNLAYAAGIYSLSAWSAP